MAEYIEREKLIKHYENCIDEVKNANGITEDFEICLKALENQPAADVAEVRHGKNITQINPVDEFICSECGFRCGDYSEIIYEEDGDYEYSCECVFNYCPRCGAKMDGSEEE